MNLKSVRDESKTGALSNSAKLLAGYMKATGVFEAKTISETLGIPLRTVQRLKLEIACANDAIGGVSSEHGESAKHAMCATRGVAACANSAMDGVSEAPNAPPVAFSAPAHHARIETPSGLLTHEEEGLESPPSPSHVQPVGDWRSAFGADDQNHGVTFAEGRLALVNGTRAFWLERFGGDAVALDLALIEAAGSLQRSSNASLKLQVERKLANIARDTRDRDRRYERVAGKNRLPKGVPTVSPMRALLNKSKVEVRA